ncbi:uncharacterized protein [Ptychodera flava]|uniref:uncharacterized protein n=1 Tax=Ptychodera flava TaxID=63121 RepID=UPI003969D93D
MGRGRNEAVESVIIVCQVHRSVNLSPGGFTTSYAVKLNQAQKRQQQVQSTREFKRRRLASKGKRHSAQASQEIREGETFKSCINLETSKQHDTVEIPSPITAPSLNPVSNDKEDRIILFDTKTSGLGDDAAILQLSANTLTGSETFDRYILPENVYMNRQASQITGLSIVVRDGKKVLLHNGKSVPTVSFN